MGSSARTSWGTGSIRQVRPGTWDLRLSAGTDPVTGRRRQIRRRVTGTKREALEVLDELRRTHAAGTPTNAYTLRQLIAAWREHATHAPATSKNYDRALERIPATLLDTRADRIQPHDLQRLYTELGRQGHGTHAVRLVHAVISGAFSTAVRWRWMRESPARYVDPPKPRRRRDTTPTPEQVAELLALANHKRSADVAVWFRLVVVTGARTGEVVALRWSDVDLEAAEISIRSAIDRTAARAEIPTKTDGSNRTIPIDADTVKALKRWRTMQRARALEFGQPLVQDPYVLSTDIDGARPMRPDVTTRRFRRLADRAGLHDVRLHDMRHAAATIMLAAGIDPKTVADRLGHTRVSTTLDRYGHVLDERARAAADVLGDIAR